VSKQPDQDEPRENAGPAPDTRPGNNGWPGKNGQPGRNGWFGHESWLGQQGWPGRIGQPEQEGQPGQEGQHGLQHGVHRWLMSMRGGGPMLRRREDGLIGGVAAGMARKAHLDVNLVRCGFVVVTLLSGGLGVAGYVLAWLLLPAAGGQDAEGGEHCQGNIASRAKNDGRGIALAAGLVSLVAVLLLIIRAAGGGWLISWIAWPLVFTAAGVVLIWRNDPEDQAMMRRLSEPLHGLAGGHKWTGIVVRLVIAAGMVIGGLLALQSGHKQVALLRPLVGVALIVAAIVIVLGPWWLRIARDLVTERQARIRAEERADMASRVHDSVLQTLALIQRKADDPQMVIQFARAQERELRAWLFDGKAPGSIDEDMTLAGGIRLIQQEVEAKHGVAIEAVTVGDCALDDDLTALLGAAREATVNAVKWSGASVISLFAEVEPGSVSVFVRDRGRGFDPDAVPGDRKGLAESIRARMARRGGSATVRSTLGEGTEVSLTMPRAAGERQPSRT
jgi:signal transduction histidine kinase/phage shock protein PspC (stress-responsive transcriptional regulator)